MEDKLLKYPAEIEGRQAIFVDLKQTSKRLQLIRRLWKDSAVWKFWAKHYMEKEDAGEMILAACKRL